MNTFDAVLFGAALCTLAGFWIRHEVLERRRRKDAREMLAALKAGSFSANEAREVDHLTAEQQRKTVGVRLSPLTAQDIVNGSRRLARLGISLALLLCAGAAWGQEWRPPQPGPLCGQRISTPQTALVEIACPDFDALAKLGVPAAGRQLQVLVHAKYGDAVRVEAFYVDFEGREASIVRFSDLTRDSYGRLIAMPSFPGWDYTRLKVNVKRDAE